MLSKELMNQSLFTIESYIRVSTLPTQIHYTEHRERIKRIKGVWKKRIENAEHSEKETCEKNVFSIMSKRAFILL